ncbi:isochorismatase family cysteine hydrolase [Patescibacteria group bacterium]
MKKQTRKNKALILIDMQDFFLKKFVPSIKKNLIHNQTILIDKCIKNKIPIIVLEYKCRGIFRGETIPQLKKKVKPMLKEIIIKESNSGFTDTKLDTILKDLKVKEVILAGINANGCIQDTAIGALHRGYKVTTSFGVIANLSRKDLDLSKRNKDWFMNNTTFFEDVENLVNHLK